MAGGVAAYVRKMRGGGKAPPAVRWSEVGWSWLGAFLGMLAVAALEYRVAGDAAVWLIGSFGATAVLVYGAIRSPLAQPRNVVGGHVVSAVVGVACQQLVGDVPGLAAPLAVATAIALMHLTRTLHPPGGATALIAVIAGPAITGLGFLYVAVPVGGGAVILTLVAVLVNNLSGARRYPEFWW